MPAFSLFSREKRDEVLEIIKWTRSGRRKPKPGVVSKMLGKMWKDMAASDKKPYEDRAKKAKEEYDAAVDDESD